MRLNEWVTADQDAVERCAESVVESLGPGWSLARDRAERPTFCNAEGFARFRYEGLPTSEFVLVPGGTARLGFGPETWEPSDALAGFWEAVRAGMPGSRFDRDLREYIASETSPAREIDPGLGL